MLSCIIAYFVCGALFAGWLRWKRGAPVVYRRQSRVEYQANIVAAYVVATVLWPMGLITVLWEYIEDMIT